MTNNITIIKQDPEGEEVIRYEGRVIEREKSKIVIEASFVSEEVDNAGILIRKGDRFIESYYSDLWYNIFEIRSGKDGTLKGWYCNVGYPALFEEHRVSYRDLALDLVVHPDGRQIVVDKDEFDALPLSAEVRHKALNGLAQLQTHFRTKSYV